VITLYLGSSSFLFLCAFSPLEVKVTIAMLLALLSFREKKKKNPNTIKGHSCTSEVAPGKKLVNNIIQIKAKHVNFY